VVVRSSSLPSLKIVTVLFGALYTICFYMDWSLFRYYPETGEFYWRMHAESGPAILWYGWLAIAAIVSVAVALAVPRRWADRLPASVVWVVPLIVVVVILIYEVRWFI
jgi:hypothetical protein